MTAGMNVKMSEDTGVHECVVRFDEGELDLVRTLQPGQSFTWTEVDPGVFEGVLHHCLFQFHTTAATKKEEEGPKGEEGQSCPAVDLHCRCTSFKRSIESDEDQWVGAPDPSSDLEAFVRWYFRADESLASLYAQWSGSAHPLARGLHTGSPGVRLLRQEPIECVMSYICSQNNHVPRIHALVQALRDHYGVLLNPDKGGSEVRAFPTLKRLASVPASELADLRFGYRAEYIPSAAKTLLERGGAAYLHKLADKTTSTAEALEALKALHGVGPKVAACVALYALEKHELVPLDVHMLDVATRALSLRGKAGAGKRGSRLQNTPEVRERVQEAFVEAFGPYAGWAQALLFIQELDGTKEEGAPPSKKGRK